MGLVDPNGLDWGVSEWDDKKGHHTNYRWFNGKIGKGYAAVNFGKSGSLDVPTDNGQIVRISNRGLIRQVIYAGPGGDGLSNGRGSSLNLTAGMLDGAIPFGKHIREAAFGKMGVDTGAPEYKNGAIISGGVVIGAQLLTGSGEAKAAEEVVLNLGGEGEVAGALNVQGNGLWTRHGKQVKAENH